VSYNYLMYTCKENFVPSHSFFQFTTRFKICGSIFLQRCKMRVKNCLHPPAKEPPTPKRPSVKGIYRHRTHQKSQQHQALERTARHSDNLFCYRQEMFDCMLVKKRTSTDNFGSKFCGRTEKVSAKRYSRSISIDKAYGTRVHPDST